MSIEKITNFMLHSWIDVDKFRGVSRISAFFLNIIWGAIKLVLCLLILLFVSPYLIIINLRSRNRLNIFLKIILVLCYIICIPMSLAILFMILLMIQGIICLLGLGLYIPSIIAVIILGIIAYGLIRLFLVLTASLFAKGSTETEDDEDIYDVDNVIVEDEVYDDGEFVANDIDYLWKRGNEADWHNALEHYYSKLSPRMYELDSYLESISAEDVKSMSTGEFYDFLHNKYYVWKFTGSYLSGKHKSLQKNSLEELNEIKHQLFETNPQDIDACLRVVTKIGGLGIAGGSGLLSILFPEFFGTVDKFLVMSLEQIPDLKYEKDILSINQTSISHKSGVLLVEILREKASELNARFDTDFWTPRKIDMVLWSIGR